MRGAGLAVVWLAAAAAACGDDDGEGEGGPRAVSLRFEGLVGGQAADCGGVYTGLGTEGSAYELQDYRLYVSNVRLLDGAREVPVTLDQDGAWQYEGTALLDFEAGGSACTTGDTRTNDTVRGTVAEAGPFDGVRFELGVPFELNHQDVAAAPAPLNVTAMFWSWQGGYKFLRLDGQTQPPGGDPLPWFIHLGSTGCDGDPLTGGVTTCTAFNRPTIELTGLDPDTDRIVVDVAEVLAESDLTQSTMAPGCMSGPTDPECPSVLARLGLGGAQQLFSAAP